MCLHLAYDWCQVLGLEVYSTRRSDADPQDPCGVLGASQPSGARRLAWADPRLLSPWRKKLKPRWGKAWAYAQKAGKKAVKEGLRGMCCVRFRLTTSWFRMDFAGFLMISRRRCWRARSSLP